MEDPSKLGIGADPGKLIHETPNSLFSDIIDLHERLRPTVGAAATTSIAVGSAGDRDANARARPSLAKKTSLPNYAIASGMTLRTLREETSIGTFYNALAIKQYPKYMFSSHHTGEPACA